MSTKISELTALSGGIPATNAVPISVDGVTYKVNLGNLAENTGSADVLTALGAANKAALSDAIVDGTAIDPTSIGATTGLASLHLANEAEIVAHEAGGAVQARLAYLNGYSCWVFMNPTTGFSNLYGSAGYFTNLVVTQASFGFGISLHGTTIGSRGNANTVAFSNGANAQTFEIYATDTSSTNYERLSTKYNSGSGAFEIGTEKGADGGSARPLNISIDGNVSVIFSSTGTVLGANNTITSFYTVGDPTCQIGGGGGQGVTVRARGGYGFSSDTNTGTHALRDTVIHRTGAGIATVTTGAYNDPMGFFEDLYRRKGAGSPESVVTAPVGAVYHRTDGGANTSFYVKESGSGNTGWVAK